MLDKGLFEYLEEKLKRNGLVDSIIKINDAYRNNFEDYRNEEGKLSNGNLCGFEVYYLIEKDPNEIIDMFVGRFVINILQKEMSKKCYKCDTISGILYSNDKGYICENCIYKIISVEYMRIITITETCDTCGTNKNVYLGQCDNDYACFTHVLISLEIKEENNE